MSSQIAASASPYSQSDVDQSLNIDLQLDRIRSIQKVEQKSHYKIQITDLDEIKI